LHDKTEHYHSQIRNVCKDRQNFTATLCKGKIETPTPATAGATGELDKQLEKSVYRKKS